MSAESITIFLTLNLHTHIHAHTHTHAHAHTCTCTQCRQGAGVSGLTLRCFQFQLQQVCPRCTQRLHCGEHFLSHPGVTKGDVQPAIRDKPCVWKALLTETQDGECLFLQRFLAKFQQPNTCPSPSHSHLPTFPLIPPSLSNCTGSSPHWCPSFARTAPLFAEPVI